MVMKKTLNAKNLEALGAERLAELLMEISGGNAVVKRRLRLELAGAQNPAALARAIRKRLAAMARSRTFVDWRNRRRWSTIWKRSDARSSSRQRRRMLRKHCKRRFCPIDFWGSGGFWDVRIFRETAMSLEGP
jgi:hypothetical protein